MKNYPIDVYKDFEQAVDGSKKHFHKLLDGGYPEWAAFSNAIQGDREAVKWLLTHGFTIMGILANAILEEPNAIEWLKRYQDPFYYFFFGACRGEDKSKVWLEERHLYHFLIIAEAIRKATNYRIKKEVFWYVQDW